MHRRPNTFVQRIPTLLTVLAVTALTVAAWAFMIHNRLITGEFDTTGWIAWHTQNPFIDWDVSWHGGQVAILGHRFGVGAYGSWVPFMSPNGGRYVTLFGHTYGVELWGHVGPFIDTD